EGQTGSPEDHSASDNLFMRALHLRERRLPGYSYCPVGGFDALFEAVGAIAEAHGAEVRRNVSVASVAVENGSAKGVYVEAGERRTPNELLPLDRIDADAVILTLPVWQVRKLLPAGAVPDWYLELIGRLTPQAARGSWIGFYAACTEPPFEYSER